MGTIDLDQVAARSRRTLPGKFDVNRVVFQGVMDMKHDTFLGCPFVLLLYLHKSPSFDIHFRGSQNSCTGNQVLSINFLCFSKPRKHCLTKMS